MTITIRHATRASDRPVEGIGGQEWDQAHEVPLASQAEAEAGTATDKLMTPQRTAQAIAALGSQGSVDVTGGDGIAVVGNDIRINIEELPLAPGA